MSEKEENTTMINKGKIVFSEIYILEHEPTLLLIPLESDFTSSKIFAVE